MSQQSPTALERWITTLRAIVAAVEASDVRELELRTFGLRIVLRRSGPLVADAATTFSYAEQAPVQEDLPAVRSPLTGIWYDAPAPGVPPYVNVGDYVDVGFVIGLVETMKVFNEVTADMSGVVRQILVQRGELVMANAPLLILEPAAEIPLEGGNSL